MNGKVVFTEKTLDAKAAADAVGRVLSGAMDYRWCLDNNQLSARGLWDRTKADVLIHKPVALWKKMCSGYHPREGRDYEFVASGTHERPDVGCYGDDTDGEDESAADDIEGEDDNSANLNVTIAGVTDTSTADSSWRAEVVDSAVDEDALDTQLEAAAEAELWGMARAEAAAATCRLETAYRRALETVRRRWAIANGARPEIVGYALSPDIVVFEGEIYRVIDVPRFKQQGWAE